ncbi:hypothetical protein BU15DRAFT_54064 [Melanogaster broomeanus]|nr:hypothetical protein BU15DRAFT_54064 [Melanogaster broomeanus]
MYGAKKRVVFRLWPRDPKGKPILPFAELKGKSTPNGFAWGASLYDFYNVCRIPGVSAIAKLSGSKLLNVMSELGEFYAKAELLWAVGEEDPRVEPVADTKVLIEAYENRVPMGIYNEHSMIDARIPLHLLPETLYVHDPFNALSLHARKVKDITWLSQPVLIRKYTLSLSPDVQ